MGEDVVRDLDEARGERADLDGRAAVVLLDRERLLDQLLVTPGADHGAEGLPRARRHDQPRPRRIVGAGVAGHGDRLLARGQQQRVGVGDEIDEVVGVHMRDHHRVDLGVVDVFAQLPEHPATAVEEDRRLLLGDQIPAAGSARVLPCRRLAEHRDPHLASGL